MKCLVACLLILLLAGATGVVIAAGQNSPRSSVEDPGRDGGKPRPTEDLYGDLYIIERNPDTGEPFTDDVGCTRPLYEDCGFIPLLYETTSAIPEEEEEDDPCDVDPLYVDFLQAVDMGRLSVTRAPQDVIAHAYDEAIARINGATDLSLDPAGRLLYCPAPCDDGEWFTIDSPLENLAMYQKLMMTGSLEDAQDLSAFDLSYLTDFGNILDPDTDDYDRAASFLAAAADKTSFVSSDAIVTINTFLGVNTVTPSEDPTVDVEIDYHDYTGYKYEQDKCYPAQTDTLLLAPFPPEWICPDTDDPMQCFYADLVLLSDHAYLFKTLGFCKAEESVPYDPTTTGGLLQFTQAVEHSRSVISFMHNWSVPVY